MGGSVLRLPRVFWHQHEGGAVLPRACLRACGLHQLPARGGARRGGGGRRADHRLP